MVTTLLLALAAGQAAAPTPMPAPQAAAPVRTLQQQFDAASAALDANRCADAMRDFAAIKASAPYQRNAFLAATVDLREGRCLARLGQLDAAEAAIRRSLPAVEAKGGDFGVDVREGRMVLGEIAASRLDYDAAAREYSAAADTSKSWARIAPLLRVASVLMFDRDGRALAAATEARTIAFATPELDKKQLAQVQTVYARVLLNEGRHAEAYKELKDGLAKQGGLDTRVTVSEIVTRSDLAIAALKTKDLDGARQYLAYTGAGRMADSPFVRAAVMDPPVCDPAGGLTPEDQAVVEFGLSEDGRVVNVQPVYTTGKRPAALAFARAVQDWSWRAEDAARIPPFFRQASRVEMRCVKAPEAPSLMVPLRDATIAWLDGKGAGGQGWDDMSAAAALPLQRAAFAKAQAANDRPGIVRAGLALAASPVTDQKESESMLKAARAALGPDFPVEVRAYTRLMAARADDADADLRDSARALLADPEIAADPLSAATMRVLVAARTKAKPPADAPQLLQAVSADTRLPARHPLKTAALLAQANALSEAGDAGAARAAFERTGLTNEQCALVGLQPAMRSANSSASDYPDAAVRMGFEGWVRTEFDITADGRTAAPRAVIAYPPFVFDEAATGIMQGARFTSSYRPQGALACAGRQQAVSFRLSR
jgi:outer membrane biosynthesis protein TonB